MRPFDTSSGQRLTTLLTVGLGLLYPSGGQAQSVWDGVYTSVQADRGAVVYRQACRKCHFADLSGAGDAGATPGEVPPALAGTTFLERWTGVPLSELVLAVSRGMPGDRPGTLRPQATADVVSYILQANNFPTGERELPSGPERLETVVITEQPTP